MAGYETVFADFVELLGAIKTRAVVAPLLKQWLDYDVVGLPKASEIRAVRARFPWRCPDRSPGMTIS